jgi:thymidine kinase
MTRVLRLSFLATLAVAFCAPFAAYAKEPLAHRGKLTVISGCMFSGKTEELMRLLRRSEIAGRKIITIKNVIDNRVNVKVINSHAGKTRGAKPAYDVNSIRSHIGPDIELIGIDEIQFFPKEVLSLIEELIENGVDVIASGLDTDFKGLPFGVMPQLLAIADEVIKLSAICVKCGSDARHTQRVLDGKPADWNSPLILVGGTDSYEARCRGCFEINRPADALLQTIMG